MKLIVGLGNPGAKFLQTRHNIGFMFVDYMLNHFKIAADFQKNEKFKALYLKTNLNQEDYIFLKPQTFMNNSGQAVRAVIDYFKIDQSDLLVIYDDLDIPFGKFKLTQKPPHKHNGVNSLIAHLKNANFAQIRLGIRGEDYLKIKNSDLSIAENYVLKDFNKSEKADLVNIFQQALTKYLEISQYVY